MRIVEINDVASVASEISAGLRERGHDITLLRPRTLGASLPRLLKPMAAPARAAEWGRLIGQVRSGHYDLAHIHYAYFGMLGAIGRFPYILHCHGTDLRDPSPMTGRMVRRALKSAAHVFYSTPDLAPYVTRYREDAEFLPNPIDTHAFRPRLPAGAREDVFVCCALTGIKGAPRILDACARLAEERPDIRVTAIAGGEYTDAFAALPNVTLLHRQRREFLPRVINDHGVVIGWVEFGIAGMAELEAMACGRPVINWFTEDAAYPEPPPVIREQDGTGIAREVARLVDDAAERDRIGEASRAWVERYHRLELAVSRVEDVAMEIVARRKGSAGGTDDTPLR